MKSALNLHPLSTALVLMGALAVQPDAYAGASRNPVCTPARDVSSVLGRGASVAVQVQCQVERKARSAPSGGHVSAVLGRAGTVPHQTEQTAAAITVHVTGIRAVETSLGRAGGAAPHNRGTSVDTVAAPVQ